MMIDLYLEQVEDIENSCNAASTFMNDPFNVFELSAEAAKRHREAVEALALSEKG